MRILYIPLDERPCNLKYPVWLSQITGEVQLIAPPASMLGKLKRPADTATLWSWVLAQAKGCDGAILSVDTLVYGNIINSRTHHLSIPECDGLLANFRTLKAENPQLTVHAFNLVARVAAYDSAAEDPDYWATHGRAIWRYAYLTDKDQRGHADEAERAECQRLTEQIPAPFLEDFLARRKVTRHVNLAVLDLLAQNVFYDLTVPKDDTAEYGYAAMDQRAIAEKVRALRLMDRVLVYPGADEAGCVLFARAFCRKTGFTPRVQVRYSSVNGPGIVPTYEDRPLHESVKAQITSAGGVLVDSAPEADLLLAVHSPALRMIESADQDAQKDVTYYSHHCLPEFLRYLRYFLGLPGRACALADVCYGNGADKEMMETARLMGILDQVDAYGGWNTAMNTVGVALAHGIVAAWLRAHPAPGQGRTLSETFLLRKIIEDWLFQADLLGSAIHDPGAFALGPVDPYALGAQEEAVRSLVEKLVREKIAQVFPEGFRGRAIRFGSLSFPWNRIFEIDFDLALE